MSDKFVITAQLQIQGPSGANIGSIINTLNKQLKGVNANISINTGPQVQRQLANINTNLSNVSKNAVKAHDEIEKFGSAAAASLRRFAGFTIVASTFYTLAQAISSSTKDAIAFQREMVKISQVTGTSLKDLDGLNKEVTRLATGLGVSSQKLLNSAQVLAQAGLSAKDTRAALEALAKTDLSPTFDNIADTTEGAIAIMNQFKIGAEDLDETLGSLNAVAGKFAVESSDLITAVRRTGGAFEAAGGSLNELLALFTAVRSTTRESAESIATGFRTIFTRIQRTRTVNFLDTLGIQLRDLEGQFVGPFEAIRRLSGALQDLESTDPRFAQIIEELGGFRQVSKVIPLIQEFSTAQKALIVAQTGANSLTTDAAKANQALSVQIAKVREEFEALIRKFVASSAFTSVTDGVLDLASAFIKITEAIEPVLPLLTSLAAVKLGNLGLRFGASFGRKIGAFADGGLVPGSGSGDTYPAMLTPGEFVVRKSAVKAVGASNLGRINRFASAGPVKKTQALSQELLAKRVEQLGEEQVDFIPGGQFGGLFLQPEGSTDVIRSFGILSAGKSKTGRPTVAEFTRNYVDTAARKKFGTLARGGLRRLIKGLAETLGSGGQSSKIKTKDFNRLLENRANFATIEGSLFEGALSAFSNTTGGNSQQNFDFGPGASNGLKILFGDNLPSLNDAKRTDTADAINNLINKALNEPSIARTRQIVKLKDLPEEAKILAIQSLRGSQVARRASGGPAPSDTVPALLTPGEFVINKDSAARIGLANLHKLNQADKVRGFAKGGPVQKFAPGGSVLNRPEALGIGLAILPQLISTFGSLNGQTQELVSTITSAATQFSILVFATKQTSELFGRGSQSKLETLVPQRDALSTEIDSIKLERKSLGQQLIKNRQLLLSAQIGKGNAINNNDPKQFQRFRTLEAVRQSNINKFTRLRNETRTTLVGKNTEFKNVSNNIDLVEKRAALLNKVTIAGALGSAAAGAGGQFLQNRAASSLSSGDSGAKDQFAFGGALSSAAQGAGFGLAIGSLAGPVGAAIGAVSGALIFGAKGYIDAAAEAERTIKKVRFDKFFDGFQRQLNAVSEGRTNSLLQLGSFRTGVSRLETELATADTEGKESTLGRIQESVVGINTFLTELTKSATTLAEFESLAGDSLRIFADFTNTPIEEVRRQFENMIKANETAAKVTARLTEAQRRQFDRVREINNLTGALNETIRALSIFSANLEQIEGFASGSAVGAKFLDQSAIFNNPSRVTNTGAFANIVNQTASAFGGQADSLAAEVVASQKAISELPEILLRVAQQGEFEGEGGLVEKLDAELKGVPDFVRSIINANLTTFLGPEAKPEKATKAIQDNLGQFVKTLSEGALEPLFEFFQENTRLLTEQTNQLSSIYAKRRAVELQMVEAQLNTVGLQEQQAEFNATRGGRGLGLGTALGFEADRQRAILGGDAGLANNPTAIGNTLRVLENSILAKSIKLQDADFAERTKLLKEIDTESSRVNRLNKALQFLSDATARTAAQQKELSQLEGRRNARLDVVGEFAFGDQETRRGINRQIIGAQAIASGSAAKLPQSIGLEGFNFLKSLRGLGEFGFLGGKTAEDAINLGIESIADRDSGAFGGLSGADLKKFLTAPSVEETLLRTAINEGFTTAITSQNAIISGQNEQRDKYLQQIVDNTDKFVIELRKNSIETFVKQTSDQKNEVEGRKVGQEKTQDDINKLVGFVTGKVASGQEKIVIEALARNRNLLPDLNKRSKSIQGFNRIGQDIDSSRRLLSNIGNKDLETQFQDFVRELFGQQVNNFGFRSFAGLTQLKLPTSDENIAKFAKDGEFSRKEIDELRDLANTKQSGLGDKLFSNIGKELNFNPNTDSVNNDELANFLEKRLSNLQSESNENNRDLNTLLRDTTNNTDLSIGELGELLDSPELIKALNNLPEKFSFDNFNTEVNNTTNQLIKLKDNLFTLNSQLDILKPSKKNTNGIGIGKLGMAKGGFVPGVGTKDTVPAMLTPGEFVMSRDMVKAIGMAEGGVVGANDRKRAFREAARNRRKQLESQQSKQFNSRGQKEATGIRATFLAARERRRANLDFGPKKPDAGPSLVGKDARDFFAEERDTRFRILESEGRIGPLAGEIFKSRSERIKENIITKGRAAREARDTKRRLLDEFHRPIREPKTLPSVTRPTIPVVEAPGRSSFVFPTPIATDTIPFGSSLPRPKPSVELSPIDRLTSHFKTNESAAFIKFNLLKKILNKDSLKRTSQELRFLSTGLNTEEKNILRDKISDIDRKRLGFNTGGHVPGTVNADTVPALLTPGEFVLNRGAVKNIGIDNLHKMNSRGRQKFADGGSPVSGGAMTTLSPEALSAFNKFGESVNKLSTSLDSFPREVSMSVKHSVEVIHNGAEVFAGLQPSIIQLVQATTSQAINNMLKNKFPDVGTVNN